MNDTRCATRAHWLRWYCGVHGGASKVSGLELKSGLPRGRKWRGWKWKVESAQRNWKLKVASAAASAQRACRAQREARARCVADSQRKLKPHSKLKVGGPRGAQRVRRLRNVLVFGAPKK